MRLCVRLGVYCLSAMLVSGSLLMAAEGPELIPQTVTYVIRMQAPKTTIKEASSFVDQIQPGYGQLVSGQAGMLGVGISNPTMQGVDQSRDWYAAVFQAPGQAPTTVFVIPALDTDMMGEAIGEEFNYIAKDKYGIYSESEEAIKQFQTHLDSTASKSVADIASPEMKKFMGAAHLAVFANLKNVKTIYANELAEAREQYIDGIKQAQAEMPEIPGVKLDWLVDVLEQLGGKVEIAVQDAEAYAVALTLAKTGIRLEEYLEFETASRSSGFLATYPPETLSLLNKLPAKQIAYGCFGKSFAELNTWGMNIVPKMIEMNDEQKANWEEAKKLIADVTFGASGGSFSLGDLETGLLRAVSVAEVNPADKMRETTAKVATVMNGMEFPGMKQEMTLHKGVETVDGVEVDLLVTRQIVEEDADLGGLQAQMNQFLYGPDGAESRIAYVDGAYVQSVGGGKESMQAALAAFKSGSAGTDAVVARDMKALGDKTNLVGLFDLQTLVMDALKIAVASPFLPPMPFDEEALDDLNVERSYIGVSVSTSANGCTGTLHIPKETLQAAMKMYGFFMQNFGQQNAF